MQLRLQNARCGRLAWLQCHFGEDDAKFGIGPTDGSVTQTAIANIGNMTEKFFKAAIEVDVANKEAP